MRKCPVCDKTFDDSMRFCQTDGTALVDFVEEAPDDPFKTMVARPEDDFASAIPPSNDDPFKTMVAGSQPRDESGDLLQLPEEFDAMKTSVVSQSERDELGLNEPQAEAADDFAPSTPVGSTDLPPEPAADESPNVFSQQPPDPPKFSEPSLTPPDFSDMSSYESSDDSDSATELMPPESLPPSDPFSAGSSPFSPEPPAPKDNWGASPFTPQNEAPIPSPFGDAPQSSYEKPSAPMPSYQEPEPPPTVMGANPFDQPPSFGQQDPFNQPFNPPAQQNEWSPPPAPVANWQDQGLGANTPFQPPMAAKGQNQTLPIVSLVLGIVSICCPLGVVLGPAALITGFLGIKNINNDPNQFTGKGLAIAGMITGGLFFLLSLVWWILQIIGMSMGNFSRF
ncbi:MAG: DUF4190 domain-containing protein [Pyrinomonadaceae bacterium]